MLGKYKVVALIPCSGQSRYLRIVTSYLRKEDVIDEIRIWLTKDQEFDNPELLESLVRATDKNFRAVYQNREPAWTRKFYHDCCDVDTIYLKIDSDIVYIHSGAVETILHYLIDNSRPFVVAANVVNNGLCTFIHCQTGAIDAIAVDDIPRTMLGFARSAANQSYWQGVPGDEFFTQMRYVSDNYSIYSARFAEHIHRTFLDAVESNNIEKFFFQDVILSAYEHWSINVYAFRGKDYAEFGGEHGVIGDEIYFGQRHPRKVGRPVEICGSALFVHHAFGPQRNGLMKCLDILPKYEELAEVTNA